VSEPLLADVPPEAVALALELHQRGQIVAWAGLRGDQVEDRPDMILVVSGRPVAWTNGVHYARFPAAEADREIARATDLFRRAGVPALWRVTPASRPADLAERLQAHGWRYHDDLPFLAVEIDRIQRPSGRPDGLVIERAHDERSQAAWEHAMEHGFGMSKTESEGLFALARRFGTDPAGPWVRFAGLVGGEAMASSGLLLHGGVAGVYNVTTVIAARRRGVGTAMTLAAIDHAAGLGYRVAVLGTSPMARRLYEHLGFREIVREAEYIWAPGRER